MAEQPTQQAPSAKPWRSRRAKQQVETDGPPEAVASANVGDRQTEFLTPIPRPNSPGQAASRSVADGPAITVTLRPPQSVPPPPFGASPEPGGEWQPSDECLEEESELRPGVLAPSELFAPLSQPITEPNKVRESLAESMRAVLDELWGNLNQANAAEKDDDTSFSRAELFSAEPPRRRVAKRKLRNVVLGIMGKLTKSNYDILCEELCNLPISQATDKEFKKMVTVMYTKSVMPEDEIFVDLYASLMRDLSKKLDYDHKKALLDTLLDECQTRFNRPGELSTEEMFDSEGNPLSEDELAQRQLRLRNGLRSNIRFVGRLFNFGLIPELMVFLVMHHLMHGHARAKIPGYAPEGFQVELYANLFHQTVDTFGTLTKEHIEYLSMLYLQAESGVLSNRHKFMIMDMQDLIKARFPKKVEAIERAKERNKVSSGMKQRTSANASPSPTRTTAAGGAGIHIPNQSEQAFSSDQMIQKILQASKDSDYSHVVSLFKKMNRENVDSTIEKWLGNIILLRKHEPERTKFPEFIDALEPVLQTSGRGRNEVRTLLSRVAQEVGSEKRYMDNPAAFRNWAHLCSAAGQYIPRSVHQHTLNALTVRQAKFSVIINFLLAVNAYPEADRIQHRCRLLSQILAAQPQTLTTTKTTAKTSDDDVVSGHASTPPQNKSEYNTTLPRPPLEEEEEAAGDDLFQMVADHPILGANLDYFVFEKLLKGENPRNLFNETKTAALTRLECCKVISATYAYARCDLEGRVFKHCLPLFELMCKRIRKLTSDKGDEKPAEPILWELYMSWRSHSKFPPLGWACAVYSLLHGKLLDLDEVDQFIESIIPRFASEAHTKYMLTFFKEALEPLRDAPVRYPPLHIFVTLFNRDLSHSFNPKKNQTQINTAHSPKAPYLHKQKNYNQTTSSIETPPLPQSSSRVHPASTRSSPLGKDAHQN